MVGIDPDSDGLRRDARMGLPTTSDGVRGLLAMDGFGDLVFDARPRREAPRPRPG
jgi:acetaldehyde dehydrogenase